METQEELLNKRIGTKEAPRLEPKKVKIVSVRFQDKTKDGKEMKSALAHFECKHPDKEEIISISKVKYLKDDKVIVTGLWVNLDEDGNFQKGSSIAHILGYLSANTLSDVAGLEIETVTEAENSQYLCLKAY